MIVMQSWIRRWNQKEKFLELCRFPVDKDSGRKLLAAGIRFDGHEDDCLTVGDMQYQRIAGRYNREQIGRRDILRTATLVCTVTKPVLQLLPFVSNF